MRNYDESGFLFISFPSILNTKGEARNNSDQKELQEMSLFVAFFFFRR